MIGKSLGPYQVVAKLGEGGMGEVYRASDSRLKRQVAIKVLPQTMAADPERLARFQREAEVLAALNHPNIAHIYGLDRQEATSFLVMELVEGPTLADRIARGPIVLDEALAIAKQIAEGLEAAHEQGIVHRDLKPANIKVRDDGTVKVLDFGLAKAIGLGVGTEVAPPDLSPTITTPAMMTGVGVILGTAAYMSPEQAKGRSVDKRSDIWSFGAVLYEMLSGERAFKGEDVSETLASILKDAPALGRLPLATPPRLRRLLERCLERDVKQRLRDIGEARVEIAKIASGAPESAIVSAVGVMVPRRSRAEFIAWSVAGVAVAAAIAFGLLRPAATATDAARVVRLPFVPPRTVTTADLGYTVVSPDGQKLVFSGRASSDSRRVLWVRQLDSLDATALPDTEDGIEPFWSPDSRSVAFGAQGKLKRVDLTGGGAQTLTDAARLNGGAWSPSGVIVFSPDFNLPLYRVAATGGERVPVTRNTNARYPSFLPDGRHFLYYSSGGGTGGPASTFVGSIDSMEARRLLPDAPAVYARPDRLLYNRNNMLVAQAFDAERLELRGEIQSVAAAPAAANAALGGRFSVSDNGVLVVQDPPMFDYQLTWFDRAGKKVGTLGSILRVAAPQLPRLSPDGRRVVVQRFDRRQELWIGDVARDTFDRLTTVFSQLAFWSPDGRSVVFNATRDGVQGIYQLPLAGGSERLLLQGTVFPSSETVDGKWLFYAQTGERTRMDLWALPLSGVAPQGGNPRPRAVVNSEFDEQQPQVSPDGRWLAYMSDMTGRFEIYVRPLTAEATAGEATRVSISGGIQPNWGRNGRELFYVDTSHGTSAAEIMTVPVHAAGTTFESGAAVSLFKVPMAPTQLIGRDYDVSPDGQLFLVGTRIDGGPATPVTIVLNWQAGLKK